SDPVVTADGRVWCMTRSGRLVGADAETGGIQVAVDYGIQPTCALRLSNEGILYVGTDIGEVWAFQLGSGPAPGVWAQEGGDPSVTRRSPFAPPPLVDVPELQWTQDPNRVGNQ